MEIAMLIVGLMVLALIVFDLIALRFGARSWQDNRRNTWW
jgi:hypothetical protein